MRLLDRIDALLQKDLVDPSTWYGAACYRPFQIGDWIQMNPPVVVETGIIDSLALGFTAVRMAAYRRIVFPNGQMASQATINLTQTVQKSMVSVPVEVAPGLDLDKIREQLLSVAEQHPKVN